MGTYIENDGNKGEKAKDSSPVLPKKKKDWTPHEFMLSLSLAAWNFCFQKCLSLILARHNGDNTPKKEEGKISSTLPPTQKKKTGPLIL